MSERILSAIGDVVQRRIEREGRIVLGPIGELQLIESAPGRYHLHFEDPSAEHYKSFLY